MTGTFDINRYILEQLKNGGISKDAAFIILKHLKRESGSNDIAVIGMACRFPGAGNADEYWRNIISGINCIGDFPVSRRQDTEIYISSESGTNSKDHYFKAGYLEEIDKFDPAFFRISPKEASLMDPYQRLLLETAWEAIEDAGYGGDALSGSKTGVYIGTDHSFRVLLPSYSQMNEGMEMLGMTGSWTSILASRISYSFNLRGPGVVVDTACSSGLVALHMACRAIKSGECDMAVAGGINLLMLPIKNNIFDSVESYEGVVRTFDESANGTTWAEGVGILLLKPLNKAIRDRDSIYAVIKGSAINNDGSSNGITAPNAQAQEEVIVKAWQDARIDPETISYVESHGTATVMGDPIEISGLTAAFRRFTGKKQFCAVGTVKTSIGHTVSASGIAAVIKVIKAFRHNRIPATLNFIKPNSFINFIESPVYVGAKPLDWQKTDAPRRAGISAFGLSGTNCHVVIEEPPEISSEDEYGDRWYLFLLSAKSEASLKGSLSKYHDLFQKNRQFKLRDLCYTLACGRGHYSYRLAISCGNIDELAEKIGLLLNSFPERPDIPGVCFGYHKLVPQTKKEKLENEITDGEKLQLTNDAARMLKQLTTAQEADLRLLDELAGCYVKGADVRWEELYKGSNARKLNLPTYAFDHKRYWIEYPKIMNLNASKPAIPCHEVFWKPEELGDTAAEVISCALIIKNDDSRASELAEKLAAEGVKIIQAGIGSEFIKISDDNYVIDGSADSYERLFSELKNIGIERIIHMTSLNGGKEAKEQDELQKALGVGIYSLLHMAKALKLTGPTRDPDIVLVSEYSCEVNGSEPCVIPENAAFFGLAKSIAVENNDIRCRCIDLDRDTHIGTLLKEILAGYHDFHVAFRNGGRYVETIKETALNSLKDEVFEITDNSVCLVTGGMGGLGLELAKYISAHKKVKFAMINRSVLPERDLWDSILESGADKKLCGKISAVREIEKNGSAVYIYSADISSSAQMESAVKRIRSELGRIAVIFHCAGTVRQNLVINKDDGEIAGVLAPKVQGTRILDKITRDDNPDCMVLFSSVSALFGFPGQGDYAAANSYLDAYSVYRNREGFRTISINWPTWRDAGMAADNNITMDGNFKSITSAQAMDVLGKILGKSVKRIVAGEINYENATIISSFFKTLRLSSEIKLRINKERFRSENRITNAKPAIDNASVKIKGRKAKEYNELEEKLAKIWASVLGIDTIDIYDNFHDMGGDSIMASRLLKALDEEYPGIISVSDLFSHPSVVQMAEYIAVRTGANTPERGTADQNGPCVVSETELSAIIRGLKNNQSDMEETLNILEKVRFLQDEQQQGNKQSNT